MTRARIVIDAEDKTGSAFRAVGDKARGLQGQIDGIGRGFAGLGGTIATALSGFGIATFVQQTVDGLLAIKDLSEATGASIGNISALEDVARRAGSSMDDARSVLLKFNMALKDTERTKVLGAALRAIGLDADKLRQMDPAQALLETAKALDQFADDGNKARLQAELFGRNVATAAPLLKELAEAGELNATVTKEQVEQADRFNKELAQLSKNATDFSRVLLSDLLPALNTYAEKLRNLPRGADIFGKELISEAQSLRLSAAVHRIENLQTALEKDPGNRGLAAALRTARKDYDELSRAAANANEQLKATLGVPRDAGGGRGFVIPEFVKPRVPDQARPAPKAGKTRTLDDPQIGQSMRDALRAIEQTDTAKIAAVNAALDELFSLRAGGIGSGGGVDEAIERLRDELQKLDPAAKAAAASAERLKGLLAGTRQSRTEGVLGDIAFLNEQFSAGNIANAEQWADAVRAVTERLADTDTAVDKTADSMKELGLTFSSAFEDAIVSGARLSDVLHGLAQDVLRIFIRKSVTEPAGNWLAGLFGAAGFFGGARADGGPVSAGRPYLVGERGPELMVPSTSGFVVPNGASAGGASVVINQTIHAGQGVSRAEVFAAAMQAKELAKAELMQQLRRSRALA